MPEKVEACPYCGGTYPHQGPTGCKEDPAVTQYKANQRGDQIAEAIGAIRNKWTIPMNSVPELRAILETLVTGAPSPICGHRTWPYTENNICVLKPGHSGKKHKDARGREFDHGGYAQGSTVS